MSSRKKSSEKSSQEAVQEWGIKENGKPLMKIKVEEQNSFFYPSGKAMKQGVVREPEVLNYSEVEPMLEFLGYNQKEAATFLDVDPGTISRWKKNKNEIGRLRTKNIMDVDEIIAKGLRIFGNEESFKQWLKTANVALGDVKPQDLLRDPYGVSQVEEAIDALSWGAYV